VYRFVGIALALSWPLLAAQSSYDVTTGIQQRAIEKPLPR
jgi:hypothetical protein